MRKLWPGPVGLWFDVPTDRRAEVARSLKIDQSDIYDEGGIVLRYPDNAFATDVLAAAGGPVALPAVGGKTPLDIAELADRLDGKVDLIFDGGPSRYNKPSTLLKVLPNRYEIVRQGVYDERIIEKMLKTTILFVCSGNTCRSAMAEALARASLVKQLGGGAMELEKRGISIISAGSSAVAGSPAAAPAVEAVKPMGGDLSAHRSKPLSVELIHQADAIFTMSRAHAAAVLSLVPAAADKTTTLDPAGDIEDPIGGSLALYVDLAAYLRQLINKRLAELKIT
jgi:protein-tyrosine-phosphatase